MPAGHLSVVPSPRSDTPNAPTRAEEVATTTPVEPVRGAAVEAYLLVFEGASSSVVPLPEDGDLVVGRGDGAQVRLSDASVSRAHARVSIAAGHAHLADLGSQNGTKINGELVIGSRPLLSGDVITILGTTLVFHSSARARSSRQVLALDAFRTRVEDELDRVVRHRRSFALAAVALGAPEAGAATRGFDAVALARLIDPCLRRLDIVSLTGSELLVLLPEADTGSAESSLARVLRAVRGSAPAARGGIAIAPADGNDVDVLLVGARAARDRAQPGEIVLAADTYKLIEIDGRSLVVADPAMLRMMALLDRLAKSDLPVLVCGETGAGKELAATVVHQWSTRAPRPLVVLNCAALPESLAESELFGHEKGAFTGAVTQKIGILEQSDGGTVFLDEIGELSLAVQAKLLRALETRRITRVGGHGETAIDLRIVAATNRDLAEEVKAGRFRQDLLFRLGGATVWLPPLRDRPREIPILAQRFLAEACQRLGRDAMAIAPEAMQLLLGYPWPGNVRELRHVMEYAAAAYEEPSLAAWHLIERLGDVGKPGRPRTGEPPVAQETTGDRDRALPPPAPSAFAPIEEEIRELERTRMAQALAVAEGNQTAAAELLAMALRTFQAKAKAYGLRQKDRR